MLIPDWLGVHYSHMSPSGLKVALCLSQRGRLRFGPDGRRSLWCNTLDALAGCAGISRRVLGKALAELQEIGALGRPAADAPVSLRWDLPNVRLLAESADSEQADSAYMHDDDLTTLRSDQEIDHDHHHDVSARQETIANALRELGVDDWHKWTTLYAVERIERGLDLMWDRRDKLRNPPGFLRMLVESPQTADPPRRESDFDRRKREYGCNPVVGALALEC